MTRKKYILKTEEIEAILRGLIEAGSQETYNKMKAKALLSMQTMKDVDEMFMDMSEDFLDRARIEPGTDNNSKQLKDVYYILNSMLRHLAQEIHQIYKKKETKSNRFIRIISYNGEAPSIFVPKEK